MYEQQPIEAFGKYLIATFSCVFDFIVASLVDIFFNTACHAPCYSAHGKI